LQGANTGILDVEIFDLAGRKVYSSLITGQTHQIAVEGFQNGLYTLILRNKEGVIRREKIIVAH